MVRIDLDYSCNGCGSGTSCYFTLRINGSEINKGYVQIPCNSSNTEVEKVNYLLNGQYPSYNSALDTLYVNGVLFNQPQSHKICQSNVCTSVSGAGTDECTTTGAVCGISNPPPADNNLIYVAILIVLIIIIWRGS
jgi:hypothetical protein